MDRKEAARKAHALVAQMTLEEKAGQLRYDAPAIPRLGIPAYCWWNEALHGVARSGTATMFPQAIGMAAMFSPELIRELGDLAATEGRAKYNAFSAEGDRGIYKGLTFWSPNVNIFRDPRWGRGQETYGEDPYLTSRCGVAYVKGLQGQGEHMKAAACAKHFAAHSGPESQRHQFDARVSGKDLTETYLEAFRACVQEGQVEAVMGAYNRLNGEPTCASHTLQEILRKQWGFQGHMVSDCGAILDFNNGHKITQTPAQSAALAVNEGCDLNCGEAYIHILDAVKQGILSEEAVTVCAERAFTTRFLLGILGEGSEYDAIPYEKVECPEHLALAREAGRKSCVLLKNKGMLPMAAAGTVAVIGPNADSAAALTGNYHGTSSRYVTVLRGIQDAMAGRGRVLYSQGCHLYDDRIDGTLRARISEAVITAKHSDRVVLVLGLDETLEGEEGDAHNFYGSGDRDSLLLPPVQQELMEAVLAVGKPTAVLVMTGSAVDVSLAQEKADAVMELWYPGAEGGTCVADLLFGKASPSGKLPLTFYYNEQLQAMPDFTDYSMTERTYRYTTGTPLYPFGYGLTYGDFQVLSLEADRKTARVSLENRGSFPCEDVVQIYIRDDRSPLAPVNPVLAGFRRVFLKPGEKTRVEIPLDENAFTVVNEQGQRIPGSGSWSIYAGLGQPDARTRELTGKASVRVCLNENA